MASRALIYYSNSTGDYVSLSIEQSVGGNGRVFDETTIEQWAVDNTPANLTLVNVRFSPEYEQIFP